MCTIQCSCVRLTKPFIIASINGSFNSTEISCFLTAGKLCIVLTPKSCLDFLRPSSVSKLCSRGRFTALRDI